MFLIYYFICFCKIISVELKLLTHKNCEKVSEELSLKFEVKKFEDNFQLTKVPSKSRYCLPIDKNNLKGDLELSCCTIQNERILKSLATDDYLEILRKQIKFNWEKLKLIQNGFYDFHKVVKEIFVKKSKNSKFQRHTEKIFLIKQFGNNLFSFINNSESKESIEDIVMEFVAKLFESFDDNSNQNNQLKTNAKRYRQTRHWYHSNRRLFKIVLFQWINRNGSPELTQSLTKAIKYFITEIKMTKSFVNVFNISVTILDLIYKCEDCILTEDCSLNIFRMSHCAYCAGEVFIVPCLSVCLQIINKCLLKLQTISEQWINMFEITEKNLELFQPSYGILNVFQSFFTDLLKIISKLQIIGQFNCKDYQKCATYAVLRNLMEITTLYADSHRNMSIDLMNKAYNEIRQQKTIWQDLGETLCKSGAWFTSLSNTYKCWNGSASSSYTWHHCTFCQTQPASDRYSIIKQFNSLNKINNIVQNFIDNFQITNSSQERLLKKSLTDLKEFKTFKSSDKTNDTAVNEFNLKELNKNNYMIFSDNEKPTDVEEGSGERTEFKSDSNIQPIQKFHIKTSSATEVSVSSKLQRKIFIILINILIGIIWRQFEIF